MTETVKEAIERLKNTDIYNLGHNDRFEELRLYEIAIDTVLEELENRIPISEIEKILEATKQLREKEINELGMSLRGSAVDILESILKNYKK